MEVEGEIKDLLAMGDSVIRKLKQLVDTDAEVFEPLSRAYGLPKITPEEEKLKAETMEKCCKDACAVPLEIMRAACEGLKFINVWEKSARSSPFRMWDAALFS